ncbi:hypothetical protein NBRC116494_10690 [Aurantivibrio plasticivorans]
MYKPEINLFHYPTTNLYIDDSDDFLFSVALGVDRLPYRSFTQPDEGRLYADKSSHLYEANYLQLQAPEPNQSLSTVQRLELIGKLRRQNLQRYSEPAVMIIDYSMPSINGLDLCSQMHNPNIKKVLLTGVADEKIAVDALNIQLIDSYVNKNEASLARRLRLVINQLEKRYFQDILGWAKNSEVRNQYLYAFDSHFADYFEEICEKHSIIEHYPVDEGSALLLFDRYGNGYTLHIQIGEEAAKPHPQGVAINGHQRYHCWLQDGVGAEHALVGCYDEYLMAPPQLRASTAG